MSAYAITSDFAILSRPSRDVICLKPKPIYYGVVLNDERLNKLYSMYCGLLVEQYAEDCKGESK